MKKILSLSLILLLVAGMLSACGEQSDNGSQPKEKVYAIATDTVFAPFEFQDASGNYVGIDIELLDAIAEDQGFKYQLNPLGFNAAVAAVEANQADAVIAGMTINDKRKEKFDFSTPYYDSNVVIAVSSKNEQINSYKDLAGKKVAVKTGTAGAEFAESIKTTYGFETVYFEDSPFMYEDVKTGNTAACFEDHPVMAYGIQQGNGLKMLDYREAGNSYGFAVAKGKHGDLINMFNDGLKNLQDNGKYQEIVDRYTSVED